MVMRTLFLGAAVATLGLLAASANVADAGIYTAVYSFCSVAACADGSGANGPLLRNGTNYYGTTTAGGANGAGVVFRFDTSTSTYTVLYDFCSSMSCGDGSTPMGNLIVDTSGDLYGTTNAGGANNAGVAYELVKSGGTYTFSKIYDFCGSASCADGSAPQAGLTYSGQISGTKYNGTGVLFGTTTTGGASNDGTVYALKPNGSEKVILSFAGGSSDGAAPDSSLVMDGSNNLWGTTQAGGSGGRGVVFELTPTGNLFNAPWTETIIFNFCVTGIPCTDGAVGEGIVLDGSGNIFGATQFGGPSGGALLTTGGIFYELTPGSCATGWCETVDKSFCNGISCLGIGGQRPPVGSAIVADGSGDYFGVTKQTGGNGDGTIFEYNGSVAFDVYDFCHLASCADGGTPLSGMIFDGSGNLWGTTSAGGAHSAGTIYEFTP
jgi:uncharacterized repeat protein (TIGR03803 family)